ncbi:hypothetical protein ABIA39_008435 [Nocardia sp. GAS34]
MTSKTADSAAAKRRRVSWNVRMLGTDLMTIRIDLE